jgi:hypothetical protein
MTGSQEMENELLAPAEYCDPVVEMYKKDVDRTLLRENLKLSVEERILKAINFHRSMEGWREAGRKLHSKNTEAGLA